jgi:hypothetical protein
MFHHPEQIAASFGSEVKITSLPGWRTTMKTSLLVSVGTAFGLLAATVAQASTVTTEHGRPLLVETVVSVSACGDVTASFGTEAKTGRMHWPASVPMTASFRQAGKMPWPTSGYRIALSLFPALRRRVVS